MEQAPIPGAQSNIYTFPYISLTNTPYLLVVLFGFLERASLVTLAVLFLQKIYLDTFLAFSTTCNHSTIELSRGRCVASQKQQTSPEMLINRLSDMRY